MVTLYVSDASQLPLIRAIVSFRLKSQKTDWFAMVGTIVTLSASWSIGDVKVSTMPWRMSLLLVSPLRGVELARSGLAMVRKVQRISDFIAATLLTSCAPAAN